MQGPGPSEGDEGEIPGIESLLNRYETQSPQHIFVDNVDDPLCSGLHRSEGGRIGDALDGDSRRRAVKGDLPSCQIGGKVPKHNIGISHCWIRPTGSVSCRAGNCSSALRPDPERLGEWWYMRDRTAAGTDRPHVDRRCADLEIADHRFASHPRSQVLNQRDVGRGSSHVYRQKIAIAGLPGNPGGSRYPASGPRQQQRHRIVCRGPRGDKTTIASEDKKLSGNTSSL